MRKQKSVPDFIIAGGVKCATTSLHEALSHHPEVFLPDDEVFYFDCDDLEYRPLPIAHFDAYWELPAPYDSPEYKEWYHSYFEDAGEHDIVGEDSPTYLVSENAPERLATQLPDVRLVFLLRDPVKRAYSHFWHNVRTGFRFLPFENVLQLAGPEELRSGFYARHLSRFYELFPREQIGVFFFEEFVRSTQVVFDDICEFIGCRQTFDLTSVETHQNANNGLPVVPQLQFLPNWLRSMGPNKLDLNHLPSQSFSRSEYYRHTSTSTRISQVMAAIVGRTIDLLPRRQYPPMKPETKKFLEEVYRRENGGLGELIERDVETYWPYMAESKAECAHTRSE